jgi:DNA polymerase-4
VLRACLLELVEHLGSRLRHRRLCARTIDVKLRTSDFRTYTRAKTLPEPTAGTEVIWRTAANLLETRVPDDWLPLRLLGVGATGLVRDTPVQGDLFEEGWRAKQRALDSTMDSIRQQFGPTAIRRAQGMEKPVD